MYDLDIFFIITESHTSTNKISHLWGCLETQDVAARLTAFTYSIPGHLLPDSFLLALCPNHVQ